MECCDKNNSKDTQECCSSEINEGKMEFMQGCMKKCRWFPGVMLILGIVAFLLGYYLDAEVLRTIWLIQSVFVVFMGTIAIVIMNRILGKQNK